MAEHVAKSAIQSVSPSNYQAELNSRVLMIPVQVGNTVLQIVKEDSIRDTKAKCEEGMTFDVMLQNAVGQVHVARDTVDALLERLAPSVGFEALTGPSGHFLVEHVLTEMLDRLDALIGTSTSILQVSCLPRLHSKKADLSLGLLSDHDSIASTPLKITGPDDFLKPIVNALLEQAPEIAKEESDTSSLTISLRSPVISISPEIALSLRTGDMILLDERFVGPESCRLWVDTVLSASIRCEDEALILAEFPTAENSALSGTHWAHEESKDAAQIIIGQKTVETDVISNLSLNDPIPFAFHPLTPVVLRVTGLPPIQGLLRRLSGQWAFLAGDQGKGPGGNENG